MMRARLFRRGLKLLVLLTAFALLFTVWYLTAYRPYDAYAEALRAQPGWREDPGFPECGVDSEGFTCNVARPGFLSWTGNLGIGLPNLVLETGEEVVFTDSLLIWPRMTGDPELGVILYEYDFREDGVICASRQLYITAAGEYRPYGDPADDTANEALLEWHELSGCLRQGGGTTYREMAKRPVRRGMSLRSSCWRYVASTAMLKK